ncbi:glycoside hydrolase family 47 protein [Xylaria sp. CBS 124048]|nr:glycoside hydrolase family 47 protein [Xylaria sp. CBS 124048]
MSSRNERRKNRNIIILALGLLFTLWLFATRFGRLSDSEFRSLERHMNHEPPPPPITITKSSFDWGKVPARYPPGDLTPLITGKPKPIPRIQAPATSSTAEQATLREARRSQVKSIFTGDWAAYRKHAWLKDALKPISGGFRDQFSGWAATLVDSLDSLWIMGLRNEFDEAVAAVASIDFGTSTTMRVNTFETNIRYLGGLLAAYDLSGREVLLAKAIELGDLIYAAFDTPYRMPVDFIRLDIAKKGGGLTPEYSVVSASPGTLSMEMTRLSQLTGNPKYYDAISRVMDVFYEGQPKTKLPGLWPMFVSMLSRDVVNGDIFTLSGGADSLYEYLPKMYSLLGGLESKYEEMSKRFLEGARALLFRPMIPNDEPILLPSNGQVNRDGQLVLENETEHLGCFLGGVYAISGRMFKDQRFVNIGSKLTLGCVYNYRSFPTGMMPERLNMVACESVSEWKKELPPGFTTAKDPRYLLRPEAIESVFIMYRITGDPVWQDLGWDMFTAIVNGTHTARGTHASVRDVTHKAPTLPQEDYTESFWFAETLKYFYLLFSPPDIISLDDYVLNTEAHPFLRPR